MSAISVKSEPEGADISIDGKFVGNTPSTLQLPVGDHTIVVTRSGYKTWERTIAATAGGNVTVNAVMEKIPNP